MISKMFKPFNEVRNSIQGLCKKVSSMNKKFSKEIKIWEKFKQDVQSKKLN